MGFIAKTILQEDLIKKLLTFQNDFKNFMRWEFDIVRVRIV